MAQTTSVKPLLKLSPFVQHYAWGKVGSESLVAQLQQGDTDSEKPYAELWMGTHKSGPSFIISDESTTTSTSDKLLLSEFINSVANGDKQIARTYFGDTMFPKFYETCLKFGQLPFLFKVLSVNQALSIQAHPDLSLAKKLHVKFPQHYKDPNHKPELCCALTRFEALCCFRNIKAIQQYIKSVPELLGLLSSDVVSEFERLCNESLEKKKSDSKKLALKFIFTSLMHSDKQKVEHYLQKLVERLSNLMEFDELEADLSRVYKLILRLNKDYPGDVGCFAPFFLNYLDLKPGESLFLGPNEPHAYLDGNCIEIMACSDNVVRAGLTPKYIDVETLCEMLTYDDQSIDSMFMKDGHKLNSSVHLFKPPVPEFMLRRVSTSDKALEISQIQSVSILLIVEVGQEGGSGGSGGSGSGGSGSGGDDDDNCTIEIEWNGMKDKVNARKGDIFLVAANSKLNMQTCGNNILAFIASINEN